MFDRHPDGLLPVLSLPARRSSRSIGFGQAENAFGEIAQHQLARDRREARQHRFAEVALDVIFAGVAEAAVGAHRAVGGTKTGFAANLEHGPARHGPGHALFAYFRDPDGHRVELFTTHYQMMDIENEPVRWNLSTMKNRPWGFPPREKWFKEASPFRNVTVKEPERAGSPYTLEKFLLDAQ